MKNLETKFHNKVNYNNVNYNEISQIANRNTGSLQMAINDKEESKDHRAADQYQSSSQTIASQS